MGEETERAAPPNGMPGRHRLLGHLVAFWCAARRGSIQAGAKTLGLNRNSLSRYLDELETFSGAQLRLSGSESRSLALTDAGRHLLVLLDPLLERLDTIGEQLLGGLQELRLGCQSSTSCYLLPGWIRLFGEERLRLGRGNSEPPRFSLKTGSTESILAALRGMAVDIGIIAADDDRERSEDGIVYRPLFREQLRAICHQNDPLARAGPIPVGEFVRHPRYLYYSGGERYQERINALMPGVGAARRMELDSIAAIKETVRAGWGVSIVPGGAIRPEDSSWLAMVPLEAPPRLAGLLVRSIALALRENEPSTPLAADFIRFLRERRRDLIPGQSSLP